MAGAFLLITPHVVLAVIITLVASTDWARRWAVSGAPFLTYALLVGAANGYHVVPSMSLWILVATLNLVYAVCATSWLLYFWFSIACYPLICLCCLLQFETVAIIARRFSRAILKPLQFSEDNIAAFNLPALEIDTEVYGLAVIRAVTISFPAFKIVADGVEVGIKLSDDVELSLRTDKIVISLFRQIYIGPVYCNIKSGSNRLNLGRQVDDSYYTKNEDAFLVETDTPMLRAAAEAVRIFSRIDEENTVGKAMGSKTSKSDSPGTDSNSTKSTGPLESQQAKNKFQEKLKSIEESSVIQMTRKNVMESLNTSSTPEHAEDAVASREEDILAATCSRLQHQPSICQPPKNSCKVTKLQKLVPVLLKRFLHKLPILYRLLLNPTSYFHPILIDCITVTASGTWIKQALDQSNIFEPEAEASKETVRMQEWISSWFTDANFALCLSGVSAWAHVPFLEGPLITNRLVFKNVMAYRVLQVEGEAGLNQVLRFSGADASLDVPSCLLPHHQHLLPPHPSRQYQQQRETLAPEGESKSKIAQAQPKQLEQTSSDEVNLHFSAHGRFPLVIDQQLLDIASAFVKASRIVEIENIQSPFADEVQSFQDFSKAVKSNIRDNMSQAGVEAIANDKFIARTTRKIFKGLESARGDIGYSGNIPISLGPYRNQD